MLDRVAEFYEEQVEASVKALTSIIEPIMSSLIGVDRWASSSSECTCRCSIDTYNRIE